MNIAPRACVIGWPINHSRSPLIHSHWLDRHDLAGSYVRHAVEPTSLPTFVSELRQGRFVGCNVTVPHKEAIMPLLDEVTPTARSIGAVNTVWRENGRLIGGNTDTDGFLANLDELVPEWDRSPLQAVILGAGGAARALAYGLKARGADNVAVVNRSKPRADAISADLGEPVQAFAWEELPDLLKNATFLVNATSLGMQGQPPLDIDLGPLPKAAVVSDIVYVPLKTPLLKEAEIRGHRTAEGLGMLLHQAVPGFEKWFGIRPKVTGELRAIVEAEILGQAG
ncbi:shikimate dehydrogenase [Terrihabitans sp. B22-R8]|uniref:shikimate dehydrogenase n=1 Tax=Terrihabitans sp. B22-R8 TaxID=3425128 RepID=UPI00403C5516